MNSLRLPMGVPIVSTERFDAAPLTEYVKNTGRAYQRQAIELVNACRLFLDTSPGPQDGRNPGMLKSTMSVVEKALKAAVEAGKTETDKASSAFREAKEKLLQYRATVHPRSQELDSMIIEKMTRANEKDEHHLRLFNQLRERRGPIVACSHTADVPSEKHSAPSASSPSCVPSPTHVRVEGEQLYPLHGHALGSPQDLTHQESMTLIPPKLPTIDSCTTTTLTSVSLAPVAPPFLETPAHRDPSIAIPSAPPQPSSESVDPRGTPLISVQDAPKNVALPTSDLPPRSAVLPTSHTPSSLNRPEPPSGPIDVAPMTRSVRRNGTIQPSHTQPTIPSNLSSRSEGKKMVSKQSQNKVNMSTRGSSSPKPTAKSTPTSILPNSSKARRSSIRIMPGAYPETSIDVDISSWVLVSPMSPIPAVPKTGLFARLFSILS